MIIYRVLFPNGKSYIGQTIYDLEKRKKEHKKDYNRLNFTFYYAIRKYGWEDLKWEILDVAETEEELNFKEQFWIKYYNTYLGNKNCNGYNLTMGGHGIRGYKPSIETRNKMSKALKGKNAGENHYNYGKHLSEEHKKNLSISQTGKKLSEETKNKIRIKNSGINHPWYNKNHTEETKNKISYKLKDRYSKENPPFLNRKHKEESKIKMSIANRGENHPNAKISREIAIKIKTKLAEGESIKNITNELNISENIIESIKYLSNWEHLLPELNDILLKNVKHNLPIDDVKIIKNRLANGDRIIDIVNDMNIIRDTICKIKRLKTYKNILPELNNMIQLHKQKQISISIEIVKEIKIKLANGEKVKDIEKELEVTKNIINNIRYLHNYKNVLPELNDKLRKKKQNYNT